jgi:hypothetical protein
VTVKSLTEKHQRRSRVTFPVRGGETTCSLLTMQELFYQMLPATQSLPESALRPGIAPSTSPSEKLHPLHVLGLGSFLILSDLELDSLTFRQRLKPIARDG